VAVSPVGNRQLNWRKDDLAEAAVGQRSATPDTAASLAAAPVRRYKAVMSAPKNELLHAVERALAREWNAAHDLVQQYESDATAAWIHAVLHKMEGDLSNSRYWYQRANRMDHVSDEPRAELAVIRTELTTDGHR
jgi:hypothetical protein